MVISSSLSAGAVRVGTLSHCRASCPTVATAPTPPQPSACSRDKRGDRCGRDTTKPAREAEAVERRTVEGSEVAVGEAAVRWQAEQEKKR